ncbi:hypothetical protein ACK1KB_03980 [Chryseobacterium sp. TY3]
MKKIISLFLAFLSISLNAQILTMDEVKLLNDKTLVEIEEYLTIKNYVLADNSKDALGFNNVSFRYNPDNRISTTSEVSYSYKGNKSYITISTYNPSIYSEYFKKIKSYNTQLSHSENNNEEIKSVC